MANVFIQKIINTLLCNIIELLYTVTISINLIFLTW